MDVRTLRQRDIVLSVSTKHRLLAEAELSLQQSTESDSWSLLSRTQKDWTGFWKYTKTFINWRTIYKSFRRSEKKQSLLTRWEKPDQRKPFSTYKVWIRIYLKMELTWSAWDRQWCHCRLSLMLQPLRVVITSPSLSPEGPKIVEFGSTCITATPWKICLKIILIKCLALLIKLTLNAKCYWTLQYLIFGVERRAEKGHGEENGEGQQR